MNMLSNETKTGSVEKKKGRKSSQVLREKERREKKERREGKEEGESKTKRTSAGFSGSRVL